MYAAHRLVERFIRITSQTLGEVERNLKSAPLLEIDRIDHSVAVSGRHKSRDQFRNSAEKVGPRLGYLAAN